MVCMYCGHETRIINSRPQKRLNRTWRRHSCPACGAVATSIEAYDLSQSIVFRNTQGRTIPFSRDKLFVSLLRALDYRPSALEESAELTLTIIGELLRTKSAIVDRQSVIAITTEVLTRFDPPAGMYYQASHTAQ